MFHWLLSCPKIFSIHLEPSHHCHAISTSRDPSTQFSVKIFNESFDIHGINRKFHSSSLLWLRFSFTQSAPLLWSTRLCPFSDALHYRHRIYMVIFCSDESENIMFLSDVKKKTKHRRWFWAVTCAVTNLFLDWSGAGNGDRWVACRCAHLSAIGYFMYLLHCEAFWQCAGESRG